MMYRPAWEKSQAGRSRFAPGASSAGAILQFSVYQSHSGRAHSGSMNLPVESRK